MLSSGAFLALLLVTGMTGLIAGGIAAYFKRGGDPEGAFATIIVSLLVDMFWVGCWAATTNGNMAVDQALWAMGTGAGMLIPGCVLMRLLKGKRHG